VNAASAEVEPAVAAVVVVIAVVAVVGDGEVDRVVEFATSDPVEHPVMMAPTAKATVMG